MALGMSSREGEEGGEAATVFLKLLLAEDLASAARPFLPHPSLHAVGLVHALVWKSPLFSFIFYFRTRIFWINFS